MRALMLMAAFAAFAETARADLPPLIPRDVLFGNPERAGPQISPDGKHLAYLRPDDKNVLQVWVRTVGQQDDRAVTADPKRGIRQYYWAYDGKHLLYLQDADGDENFHLYATNLANQRDPRPDPVQGRPGAGRRAGGEVPRPGPRRAEQAEQAALRHAPGHPLDRRRRSSTPRTPAPSLGWAADADFQVRAGTVDEARRRARI